MKQKLHFALFLSLAFITTNAQQFNNRTVLNTSLHFHTSFIFADIDNDGDIDIIATSSTGTVSSSANQVSWYKNLGNETFSAKTVISSAYSDAAVVRLLDVDEDGIKDLVVGDRNTGLSWIKNMGLGFFGTKQSLPYNSYLTTIEVGDMNNDGKDDIIVAQLNGDTLNFIRNTGGGTFVYDSMFYAPNYNIYSIEFGDLDQDQKTDLIVSSGDTAPQKIIQFEHVDGAFVQKNVYSSSASPYVFDSYLYDVDNDGKVDVVTRSSDCEAFWFKNFGNNVYSTLTPLIATGCANASMDKIGDLNLDGYLDIIYKKNNVLTYRLGTGVGALDTAMQPISGSSIVGSVSRTSLFDIDQDGDLDIFYSTDNEFGWFKNNASELSTAKNTLANFSVYPNPATSTLKIDATTAVNSYKIYSITGTVINSGGFPSAVTTFDIDINALSKGIYLLELQSNDSREVKKFVKN